MLDFFLCVIWLPIGAKRTYGFRSAHEVFTMTCMYLAKRSWAGLNFVLPGRQRDWSARWVELDPLLVRPSDLHSRP